MGGNTVVKESGGEVALGLGRSAKASTFADEAETSLGQIVENSCIVCDRPFSKREMRVAAPRQMLERDYYVNNKFVTRRFICVPCYNSAKGKARGRFRRGIRSFLKNSLINSVMEDVLLED